MNEENHPMVCRGIRGDPPETYGFGNMELEIIRRYEEAVKSVQRVALIGKIT